jgi:hypothetical protein
MNEHNQHIQLLEKAADLLGDLEFEVVFIGGATISLFIDDPAAGDIRPTDDVDCVVSATTYVEFTRIEEELRQHGFTQLDVGGGPVVRWKKRDLLFDIVPSNPSTIGFSESKWFERGLSVAEQRELPSGRQIEVFAPPHMLAAKIEAYHERGDGDYMRSKDFEDIVTILNGRTEVFGELGEDRPVCAFVREWLATLEESQLHRMLTSHVRDADRAKVLKRRILELVD